MTEYIITRVTSADGRDMKRLGRRCSFVSAPRRGRCLLAVCLGGGDGYRGTMRIPCVAEVRASDGCVEVETEGGGSYRFEASGQIEMAI